jgi:hypothetical protein
MTPLCNDALLKLLQAGMQDGSVVDEDGIYHRVFKAVVETPAGGGCSGIVRVTEDRLELVGDGIESVSLDLSRTGKVDMGCLS